MQSAKHSVKAEAASQARLSTSTPATRSDQGLGVRDSRGSSQHAREPRSPPQPSRTTAGAHAQKNGTGLSVERRSAVTVPSASSSSSSMGMHPISGSMIHENQFSASVTPMTSSSSSYVDDRAAGALEPGAFFSNDMILVCVSSLLRDACEYCRIV